MTVWWRGARIVSAVGAGVLILGGGSGVYAAQLAEPAELPLDLAAADPGTWSRWSRADEVIRFRIRLRGPGTGARLAVVTTPADALGSIECPTVTKPAIPLPEGTAVCAVGDLPAEGGLVDVLLTVPERPRDITLTAMARMRGPDGETSQQGQGVLKGSDVVTRQVRGTAGSPDMVMRPVRGALGSPETSEPTRAEREIRPVPPGPALSGPVSGANTGTPPSQGAPDVPGPSRIHLVDVPPARPADPYAGVGTLGAADLVLDAPQAVGERGWVPKNAPGASEAEKAEQRTLAFLFEALERSFVPGAPKPVVAGAGARTGTGDDSRTGAGTGVVMGGSVATAPSAVAPEVPVRPGTGLPADAAPGAVPETSGGVSDRDPAALVPGPVRAPADLTLQGQNGGSRPAVGSHPGRGTKKTSKKQRAGGRSSARGHGEGRRVLGPVGPGHPAGGRQVITGPGVPPPMMAPMGPGYPGAGQWPAGQLVPPGQVMPGKPGRGMPGKPGRSGPGIPGQVMPGQVMPGQGMLVQPGQVMPGAQPQGLGQPMPPGYPGAGQQGMAGQPGVPPQGPNHLPGGPVGVGSPGIGFPEAGPQSPQVPPASMGMTGMGRLPGLGSGPQLQLPQAGSFPAATQLQVPPDSRPQGAPLPQDLGGPDTPVRAVAESSPLLTGVRGLPAVGAAVGVLLGLLWLQRRIQRHRRLRHVL